MSQSKISDYLKFLLAICKDLRSDEVKGMKFLCQEHIPGTLELVDALDLVNLLRRQSGLIQEGELHFFEDLLVQIGRVDLARKVSGFQNGNKSESWSIGGTTTTTRFLQDERGSFRVEMVKDLGADIFEQLGFFLNPKTTKNWVTLAGKLGYTHAQVMNFKLDPTQSTQLLLHDWSTRPDATVEKLHYALQVLLRRHDAAEVLEPFLPRKETLIF